MKRILVLIPALVLAGCGQKESRPTGMAHITVAPVQVVSAEMKEWPDLYEATGTVHARSAAVVSSRVMAYVQQVLVQAGDHVRAGQTLVTLDARDLEVNVRRADAGRAEAQSLVPEIEGAVAAAKANLDLAQATFRRVEDLYGKKSVSNQEFDEASARAKAAQANYEAVAAKRAQARARIAQADEEQRASRILRDYTSIAAPFAGVVTARSVEPGNLAAPGAPLLTIEREGAYQLEAAVDESRVPLARVGQNVTVTVEGDRAQARVAEIVPAVDTASRSYTVKIDLSKAAINATVRSGMFGRVEFPLGTRKVLAIPSAAVIERGQLQSVTVVENGTARARLITLGRELGDAVEVLSGLHAGETLVSPAATELADGGRVEVRQ